MNFYLDFEATQFSNHIISIGCVAENGQTFSTFVNPGEKEKISTFITELTGITKDTLSAAPGMDDAFQRLFNFVYYCDPYSEPHYFCYGDNDADFIKASIKIMHNIESIIFAQSILYALFDYSKSVRRFFNTDQSVALRKLFSFIQTDEVVQKHDALEDAQMLKEVADQLYQFCLPEDIEKIRSIPGQKKPKTASKKKKVSNVFLSLEGSTWVCDTGDVTNGKICCYTNTKGKYRRKYFRNMETAVMWLIKYICGGSPKSEKHINHRAKCIRNAIKNNSKYCGMYWEENGND